MYVCMFIMYVLFQSVHIKYLICNLITDEKLTFYESI